MSVKLPPNPEGNTRDHNRPCQAAPFSLPNSSPQALSIPGKSRTDEGQALGRKSNTKQETEKTPTPIAGFPVWGIISWGRGEASMKDGIQSIKNSKYLAATL